MKNKKWRPFEAPFLTDDNYHKKQSGGPDGELGAAMRYLNQRYTMPYGDIIGILTDVGRGAKCQQRSHSVYFISENFKRKKPASVHTKTGFSDQLQFLSTRSTKN